MDFIISASLSISIASGALRTFAWTICMSVCLRVCRSVGRSVCLQSIVAKRLMADWIRMPIGMESGVSRGMGVLDGWPGGDRRREMGSFKGEFGASHCNQWGLCCVVVRKCV